MPKRRVRGSGPPASKSSPTKATVDSTQSSSNAPTTELDDSFSHLHISSLTSDIPLIPLRRKPRVPNTPFHFLSLPSELRLKIYAYYFQDSENEVLDLCPQNYKRFHKRLGLVRVCRQVHAEVTHFFYSTRTFRIFPTYPGRYFKTKRPLLARLKPVQRKCITSLELRLGPGWDAPPKGWAVTDILGLKDCVNVIKLNVFVEIDPSDSFFKSFRRSEGFFISFSRTLLSNVLDQMPAVTTLQFDAWPGVKKSGAMLHGLLDLVTQRKRLICWGPERGWTDEDEPDNEPPAPNNAPLLLSTPDAGYGSHNVSVAA